MIGLLERTRLDGAQRAYADNALQSAEHLLGLVNDLLDYARLEAGALEFDLAPVDLEGLVRGVAERCEQGTLRMAGSQTDISARKAAEECLRHAARHDALTGLANRHLFSQQLDGLRHGADYVIACRPISGHG